MRQFVLLATTVLLAACVHDTDDQQFFMAETGASLTYYIGSGGEGDQKNHEDPWDTIAEKFGNESVHVLKGENHDDPWDTIADKFGDDSIHRSGKFDTEVPWDTTGGRSREVEKPYWAERSRAVFVTFEAREPSSGYAKVVEVRGEVLKVLFLDGREQYVVYAPDDWTVGTEIASEFWGIGLKKYLPFLGVREWRVVSGTAAWRPVFPDTVSGVLVWPDPWDEIRE